MIQIVPKPPKFSIFSDHNAPHYGLAQLFTFLDHPDIAQSFLSVALAFPCSYNVFMGLVERDGLFSTHEKLKYYVHLKKLKKWTYLCDRNIKMVKYKNNNVFGGAVIIGKWAMDSFAGKFVYINKYWLKEHSLKACYQLCANCGKEGRSFQKKYDQFLDNNSTLKLEIGDEL